MKKNKSLAFLVIKEFFALLSKYPLLGLPYLFSLLLDWFSILASYLAPQQPFSKFFGPPIRKFFGEKYMHYPYNFDKLPYIYGFFHTFLTFTIGIIITAFFIKFIFILKERNCDKNIPYFKLSFESSVKMYLPMLVFFTGIFFLDKTVVKFLFKFLSSSNINLYPFAGYSAIVLIQILWTFLFFFVFPLIAGANKSLISSLRDNFSLLFSHKTDVLILSAIPSVLYLLAAVNYHYSGYLMHKYVPEILLAVLGVNSIIYTVVDMFIVGFSATACYILFANKTNIR